MVPVFSCVKIQSSQSIVKEHIHSYGFAFKEKQVLIGK